ncbi:MAG TPA: UDP-N-acetylmuramoyl-tripeptide--D-alanyl-D-alanine ligase [Planctomycetota bacterium]|jgi:UDP-N-acetylmuramoyl-tripeptide--D-alanyl-D-alanine ligase
MSEKSKTPWTLGELAKASGGKLLCGKPELPIAGLFSDTRKPVKGALFVALRGENFDGNRFAHQAVTEHGAAAVLIDRIDGAEGLPLAAGAILVTDTREGYLAIAAAHRKELSSTLWFAITGSVGKSTTKEMLAHVLKTGGQLNVHKAQGSFNNTIGLSHTILGVTAAHQAAVLELGTNHPGEIRPLAAVARPNIALITCAAASHLEAFHTIENVAREKAEILSFQSSTDTAVLNADSPHIAAWRKCARGKTLSFGLNAPADMKAKHLRIADNGCAEFMVRCKDEIVECTLRVPGCHQVTNALACLAAAVASGMRLSAAAQALSAFDGVERRFAVRQQQGMTIIDDAYNANPASFAAALETLCSMRAQRRFVVAGDMRELGELSARYHTELGEKLAACRLSGLVTVGQSAAISGTSAVRHGLAADCWTPCADSVEAAKALRGRLRPGDVVLVKGSHALHLEKCCEELALVQSS